MSLRFPHGKQQLAPSRSSLPRSDREPTTRRNRFPYRWILGANRRGNPENARKAAARNGLRLMRFSVRGASLRMNSSLPGWARPNFCTSRINLAPDCSPALRTRRVRFRLSDQTWITGFFIAAKLALKGGQPSEPFAVLAHVRSSGAGELLKRAIG